MNYAIIILGHKNIKQIKRLIKQLSYQSCDIYLHLNKFFSVSELEKKEISLLNSGNVFIIPDNERIGIQYDGMGMTNAIIKGAEVAFENRLNNKKKYSYYFFITAQDFPIKTNKYIEQYLENSYPKPLIDIHPWSRDNWAFHKFKKVYFHKPRTYIRSKLGKYTYTNIGRIIRAPFEVPTIVLEVLITFIIGSPKRRLEKKGLKLYGGAPWWLLPDIVVEYLVKNIKRSEVYTILKYSKTPDETLIHTFLMNSPFNRMFKIEAPDDPNRYTHTFEIFQDFKRPIITGHPHNLGSDDFDLIISQSHLFARKFDITFDEEIYNMIERYLDTV